MSEICAFPCCTRHPQANGFCIGHKDYGSTVAKAKPKGIAPKSEKKLATEKMEKEQRGDDPTKLQKWYSEIMLKEEPICWETKEVIDKEDEKGWHGSIAHILPKKLFPSVQTHPKNYLILKMWGGTHASYDASWQSAQKMKVWPLAVKRFLEIEKNIAERERVYLPDCLIKHIPQHAA